MESSDDVLINENIEDHPDNSPDDESVDTSSEQTSTFDSGMPPMLNLQTAGLRRSPRLAAQKSTPWYKSNLIARCFCVLMVATTLSWTPSLDSLH